MICWTLYACRFQNVRDRNWKTTEASLCRPQTGTCRTQIHTEHLQTPDVIQLCQTLQHCQCDQQTCQNTESCCRADAPWGYAKSRVQRNLQANTTHRPAAYRHPSTYQTQECRTNNQNMNVPMSMEIPQGMGHIAQDCATTLGQRLPTTECEYHHWFTPSTMGQQHPQWLCQRENLGDNQHDQQFFPN